MCNVMDTAVLNRFQGVSKGLASWLVERNVQSHGHSPGPPCGTAFACGADAIMGVNFFGEIAPDDFGSYDLAFITVFSMTAGNSWVRCRICALRRALGGGHSGQQIQRLEAAESSLSIFHNLEVIA